MIKKITMNDFSTIILMKNGEVYGYGQNKFNELYLDKYQKMIEEPIKLQTLSKKDFKDITLYEGYATGITKDGKVYTWGGGKREIITGDKNAKEKEYFFEMGLGNYETYAKLEEVNKFKKNEVEDVKISNYLGVILTKKGEVYTWGNSFFLGSENIKRDRKIPIKVNLPEKIKKIFIGDGRIFVIGESDKIYGWGKCLEGTLGIGVKHKNILTPTEINFFKGEKIKKVICTDFETFFLTESKKLYFTGSMGRNIIITPEELDFLKGIEINDFCASSYSYIAVSSIGEVYTWGENKYGNLGVDPEKSSNLSVPHFVKELENVAIKNVYCNKIRSIAVTENDEIYTWGKRGINIKYTPTLLKL